MCVFNGKRVTKKKYFRLMKLKKQVKNALDGKVSHAYDYGDWPIVRPTTSGDINISRATWGFISPLARTLEDIPVHRIEHNTLNAKGETILQIPMYRDAVLKGYRCLVLSTGFFEHRHLVQQDGFYKIGQKKGQPKMADRSYPYEIRVTGQEYFYMAGIWWPWRDKETNQRIDTFAIVTTKANPLMEQIHNGRQLFPENPKKPILDTKHRMPVILPEELAHDWLFKKLTPQEIKELATYQFPAGQMEANTVAMDFKKSEHPFEEVTYDELPALQY